MELTEKEKGGESLFGGVDNSEYSYALLGLVLLSWITTDPLPLREFERFWMSRAPAKA